MRKVKFPNKDKELRKNATKLNENASMRLFPYGSTKGERVATMHPSRIVMHIDETTNFYSFNSSQNLLNASIFDEVAWIPSPVDEYLLTLDFIKSRTLIDSKLKSKSEKLFRKIFPNQQDNPPKGKTIEERQVRLAYKKLEQKLEKELKIKDKEIDRLNRKLNQRGGQIADMIALGLLPGGAKPPFRLDNRIDTLSWGPDGLHMSITRSNKLKLDFIEGNYTADSKTPGFTPSQRKFWQAAKNGNPIIHIWHHYNKGSEWKWKKIT